MELGRRREDQRLPQWRGLDGAELSISADDLAAIRRYIGPSDPPSDSDLDTAFQRLGSTGAVALEVLDGRLARLTVGPAKLSVDGDVSYDNTATIQTLTEQIAYLRSLTGSETVYGVPWAGGISVSEIADQDPDLVEPYFRETPLDPWRDPRDPRTRC